MAIANGGDWHTITFKAGAKLGGTIPQEYG